MKNSVQEIIKSAIDIHVHIGPEIIPRKYSVGSLIDSEHGKIAGMVLKNHFYPTSPFIEEVRNMKGLQLFGAVVLNNFVGGLNSEVIYSASLSSDKPIVVWFPTTTAKNFLDKSKYEIAPEWVQKKGFKARKAKNIKGISVVNKKKLTNETIEVLRTIKTLGAVLATGHLSWQECKVLIEEALRMKIKNIVITHPIYQRIDMPIKIQKELAQKGCFIEQTYSMYSIDNISIQKIVNQIKKVGYENIILSSDVGQTFSPSPSSALELFAKLLIKEDISEKELFTMLVNNPRKLLSIE